MTTILKEIATSNSEPAIQIISNIVSNTEFFTKIVLPLIKTPLFDDSSYLIFLNDLIVIFQKFSINSATCTIFFLSTISVRPLTCY